jgi:hypothetical protein
LAGTLLRLIRKYNPVKIIIVAGNKTPILEKPAQVGMPDKKSFTTPKNKQMSMTSEVNKPAL